MMRVFLLRVLICSWAIPLTYAFMLPLFWLGFGDIKREFNHLSEFTTDMWKGNI